jgi:hypothetical protein
LPSLSKPDAPRDLIKRASYKTARMAKPLAEGANIDGLAAAVIHGI